MAKYGFRLIKPPNMTMEDFKKVLVFHLDKKFEQLESEIDTDPCRLKLNIELDDFGWKEHREAQDE